MAHSFKKNKHFFGFNIQLFSGKAKRTRQNEETETEGMTGGRIEVVVFGLVAFLPPFVKI